MMNLSKADTYLNMKWLYYVCKDGIRSWGCNEALQNCSDYAGKKEELYLSIRCEEEMS
jgi:hypothetical protein